MTTEGLHQLIEFTHYHNPEFKKKRSPRDVAESSENNLWSGFYAKINVSSNCFQSQKRNFRYISASVALAHIKQQGPPNINQKW